MEKPLGIGVESFVEMRLNGCYYVDKTDCLQHLIESGCKTQLIARPRRFGKSLLLDTIRTFLEVDPRRPGDASRQEKLFSGLKVMEDRAFCEKYMGRTPVLCLNFKDAVGGSFEDAYASLAEMLVRVARRHGYLAESPRLDQHDLEWYGILRSEERMMDAGNQVEAGEFVVEMCGLLAKHFGRPAVLLVDEYDTPLIQAGIRGFGERMQDFMRHLLSPIWAGTEIEVNHRPSMDKAILAGCLRMVDECFDRICEDTACRTGHVLSRAAGFTRDEADALLDSCGLGGRRKDFNRWYGGYRFGERDLCSAWSAVCFCEEVLHSHDPASYTPWNLWTDTSGNAIIDELLERMDWQDADRLQVLMDGGEASFRLQDGDCQLIFRQLKK